jgi:hypothetical protein
MERWRSRELFEHKTKRKTPKLMAKVKVGTGSKEEGELKMKRSSLRRQPTQK